MRHRTLHLLGLIVFVLPLLLLPQRHALAATLTASTPLELAGAIASANGTPATADTILLTNDIYLETASVSDGLGDTGLPYIQSQITIDGQGHTISRVVGSSELFRLFLVQSSSLTLLNVTLDYGYIDSNAGGTIYNAGTLNLVNTTISNGHSATAGGAIYNLETLNITNSTFYNNFATNGGGAVYNDGSTVTIITSNFSINASSSDGGAVVGNLGTVNITSSTFTGNVASRGGAIFVPQFGTVHVNGSTLNSNAASSGGGINNFGTLNVTNSTFTDNMASSKGGGISNGVDTFGTATIKNSTFFHNQAQLSDTSAGAGISVVGGSASVSNSVFRSNSPVNEVCTNASGSNNLADSLTLPSTCSGFSIKTTLEINIGVLTNNGGSTSTNPINAATSSAVDAAATASCASAPVSGVDQRGVLRGIDGNANPGANECDIGAFEFGGAIQTLQFAMAASSINPAGGITLPVSLSLSAPLDTGYAPVTAYIRVSGGTAVAGTQYDPLGVQTVTFNPGDQTKTLTLNLLPASLTADRTIILSFATNNGPGFSGPAHLGTQLTHTVTLKASTPAAAPTAVYYRTRNITLTWDGVSWATGYEIQVDSDASFGTPLVAENTALSAGTLSYALTVPDNGTYYWRVRAKKADGTPAPNYSPVQSFVVAGT